MKVTFFSSFDITSEYARACNGKESCDFRGSNLLKGDPCRGVEKYTKITFRCVESTASESCDDKGNFEIFHNGAFANNNIDKFENIQTWQAQGFEQIIERNY